MKATFDPARNLDLYFRKKRNGSITLSFFDVAGDDYSLSDEFEFRSGFNADITVSDNDILIEVDQSEEIKRDSYFWELVNTATGKTWLCGTSYFTDGLSAEVSDTEGITITLNGEQVNITINESTGTGDVNGGTP